MRSLLAVLGLSALACTRSAAVEPPTSDGVAATQAGDAELTPAPMPPRPNLPQTISAQTASADKPSFVIKGCASGTRSAARQDDGHDMTDAVNVSATAKGVVVSHKVPHACCLKGAVETTVEGKQVTVREQLTGNPCRCMCGSGFETTVPLAPGDYDVKVVLEAPNAKPREVSTASVTVAGANK